MPPVAFSGATGVKKIVSAVTCDLNQTFPITGQERVVNEFYATFGSPDIKLNIHFYVYIILSYTQFPVSLPA